MNKQTQSDLYFIATLGMLVLAMIYILVCAYDLCVILSNLDNLDLVGASMIFTPSFTVSNLVRSDRRYSETDPIRNFGGLHTPAYRVFNHVVKALLDSGLYGQCVVMDSRGQFKHVSYKSLFSVTIDHGYSVVSIGARQIFAVDEWSRDIYHIDSNGRLNATPYHQGYDMTDVIAQVSEALEVLKEFYTADKLKAIADAEKAQEWICYAADNLGVVKDCKRATVSVYLKKTSTKSVEWTKYWGRMTPNGTKEYKTTTGSHPSAYQVVLGKKTYWIPHSIMSSSWELHGGRKFIGDNGVAYLSWKTTTSTIDLPVWWLEKTVGLDWTDKVEPIDRSEFFKSHVTKPRRRW